MYACPRQDPLRQPEYTQQLSPKHITQAQISQYLPQDLQRQPEYTNNCPRTSLGKPLIHLIRPRTQYNNLNTPKKYLRIILERLGLTKYATGTTETT